MMCKMRLIWWCKSVIPGATTVAIGKEGMASIFVVHSDLFTRTPSKKYVLSEADLRAARKSMRQYQQGEFCMACGQPGESKVNGIPFCWTCWSTEANSRDRASEKAYTPKDVDLKRIESSWHLLFD